MKTVTFTATTSTGAKLVVSHLTNKAQVIWYCTEFGHKVESVELTQVVQGARVIEVNSDKATEKTMRTLCNALNIDYVGKGKKVLVELLTRYNVVIEVGAVKLGAVDL